MSAACWRCQLPARTALAHLSKALLPERPNRATEQLANLRTVACTSISRADCTVSSTAPPPDSRAPSRRHRKLQQIFRMASAAQSESTSSTTSSTSGLRLIVYSKDGCHLCDNLKEKLDALLSRAQFQASPLSGATLEVRDITSREDWFQKYQHEIPVLTYLDEEDREREVPRAAPRVTADRLEKHIVASIGAS